jgi:hypothetical protein
MEILTELTTIDATKALGSTVPKSATESDFLPFTFMLSALVPTAKDSEVGFDPGTELEVGAFDPGTEPELGAIDPMTESEVGAFSPRTESDVGAFIPSGIESEM